MLRIGAYTPGVEFSFNRRATSEKVAWLSQGSEPHWGAKFLVHYLQEEKFAIYPATQCQLRSLNIQDYQIFLLEVNGSDDDVLLKMILDLRVQTPALIVILVEKATSAQVVQLLGNGADAVWTIDEPTQVLRARAKSLLRRFKGFTMKI